MDVVLRSRLLSQAGFRHGFSLRSGGTSQPPFDSLNLGHGVGDEVATVEDNHRVFAQVVGFDRGALFQVNQVHGGNVHVVRKGQERADVAKLEADALVGLESGSAVGVRVADCVPILLCDARSGAVAAVHAGWRGVVARVLDAAIDALQHEAGSRVEDLLVAIGPHIRVNEFEVDMEVASQIAAQAHRRPVVVRGGHKPLVDLALAVRGQLETRGVAPTRVEDVGGCTKGEPERFFSYRRDGQRSGRHLGAVVAR